LPFERELRRFEDILENIGRIERFTAGSDYPRFVADEQVMFAVFHALLIISEAARKLADRAGQLVPEQPWLAIRALGNVLRHQYDEIEPAVVWQIVSDDLPRLKRSIEQALPDLRKS
jgi:uncharacterized protein with HEPN domain